MGTETANHYPRRLIALAMCAAAFLIAPATAHGASAVASGGKLTYTGTNIEANHLVATYASGTVTLTETGRIGLLPVLIATNGSCNGFGRTVTCLGINTLDIKTGDGGDYVDTTAVALPTVLVTGNDDDRVYTSSAADNVNTHDGADVIDAGLGTDTITGGPGAADTVSYASHDAAQPVVATLDGTQNDGCAACGENDKISSDVESLAGGAGNDTLTGSSAANSVAGGNGDDSLGGAGGDDTVDGGNGVDTVDGGAGNDRLATRDATADRLACGAGADGGDADLEDSIDADCESVVRAEPSAGTGPVDSDPTVPDDPAAPDEPGADEPLLNLTAPVIPPQRATVTAAGVARVRVECPADSGGCQGTIDLLLLDGTGDGAKAKVVAARRRKPTKIGRTRFKADAGAKPIVPVKLNRRGRRRVLRGGRKRCRVVVTTRTADGKTLRSSSDITLARRSARPSKPSKGGKKR